MLRTYRCGLIRKFSKLSYVIEGSVMTGSSANPDVGRLSWVEGPSKVEASSLELLGPSPQLSGLLPPTIKLIVLLL